MSRNIDEEWFSEESKSRVDLDYEYDLYKERIYELASDKNITFEEAIIYDNAFKEGYSKGYLKGKQDVLHPDEDLPF